MQEYKIVMYPKYIKQLAKLIENGVDETKIDTTIEKLSKRDFTGLDLHGKLLGKYTKHNYQHLHIKNAGRQNDLILIYKYIDNILELHLIELTKHDKLQSSFKGEGKMKLIKENKLTESKKTLEDKVYDDLENKELIPYASTIYNGYRIEAMNDKDIAKAKMVAKKYNLETKERKFKDYTEVTVIIPTEEELRKKELEKKQKELEQKKQEENKAKEIKESMRLRRSKKLNETWKGDDIIDDLVDRAQGYIDDGVDVTESIYTAIDDGLIYTQDIIDLANHYGVIDDRELIEKFYDDLYTDIADRVEEKDEDEDENEDEIDESIKNKKKKTVMECLKEARRNRAKRLGSKKKNLQERLITVKMDNDDVVEQLMDRLDYWTKDSFVHDLYEQMYQNYVDNDIFDGIEFDVNNIVDNDWVNYCEVISKGDESYDKILELYNKNGLGDISVETDYSYIEAAKEDKNGDLAFLVRA